MQFLVWVCAKKEICQSQIQDTFPPVFLHVLKKCVDSGCAMLLGQRVRLKMAQDW
jgi:hypothetical protein